MEPQGLSFGQPVSIVCPVIRSPQSAAREQQRGLAAEPAGDVADEPRRRQGAAAAAAAAAADGADRSSVLRTAADADNSRAVLMYVGKDGDTSQPRPASPAEDAPPPAEQPAAPARVDSLMILCQAAQHQAFGTFPEESEQQVPVGPEVHIAELSFVDLSPENADAVQYEETVDGNEELPMEEDNELIVEEHNELIVDEHSELVVEEHNELIVEEPHELVVEESHELVMEEPDEHHELVVEEQSEMLVEEQLPTREQQGEVPVQEQQREITAQEQQPHELPVQQQQDELPEQEQCLDHQELVVQGHRILAVQETSPGATASARLVVALRPKGAEGDGGIRQVEVTGAALLPADAAAGHGALAVAITPGEGVAQAAAGNLFYLYPEAQQVYAAPLPPADGTAVVEAASTTLTQYIDEEIRRQVDRLLKSIQTANQSRVLACFQDKNKEPQPPDNGRDSPSVLRVSTRHGKRQLHLSIDCDGETCCKSQDTPGSAGDSTAQIDEIVDASPPATVNEPAAIEPPPQNAEEGDSQKTDAETDVTVATPDSTADTQKAGGQGPLPEAPAQEETTEESTSAAQPNTDSTESNESSGPVSGAQDGAEDTDATPNEMPDENLNQPEAKRDDTVDDFAPDRCSANSEVKNPCAKSAVGRRRKNPIRRRILPAAPASARKPVSRKRGAATLSDTVASRGRRQTHPAELAPPKEPEKQQKRGRRRSAQATVRAEQTATDASEKPNAAASTRSTARKTGGRRRGASAAGDSRRRPVVSASPSPKVDNVMDEAPTAAGHESRRKKRVRDTAERRAAKASRSHSRDEWMLQPLTSPPGQDPPLRLVVKRRTLTVSESCDLPSTYAAKEDVISPLRMQDEEMEKSKPVLRRRRHSTNDCQSNQQENQMNNPVHFSKDVHQTDSSVHWRKRRKPVPFRNINCEEGISNGADADDDCGDEDDDDDDDDDDEDWVPKSYKYRKSVTGGHNNSNKRINSAKRRKSVASGTDELSQIPCTETVATMTASPDQLPETNKHGSQSTSTDILPVSEGYKRTAAETIVTALTDTRKSSVEEHVPATTCASMASHTPSINNQPVVSQTQHKVSRSTDESCQEPAPKKYKKAWQELWSAQQNDEQAKASLPQVPNSAEEVCQRDERCTTEPSQLSTVETSVSSSCNALSPPSSSHVNEQESSELQCTDKISKAGNTSSELIEDPHTMSDDSIETLSDTTTDESDNESSQVALRKCHSVVPRREVPVHTLHQPEGLTSLQPQGLISEGLYVLNGRTLKIRVQEVQDGPLDPALSQVPREIIEHCVQQLRRSNELVPSVHSLNCDLFPLKYVSPYNLDVKPFTCHNTGHKLERPSYPPSTCIKQEPADDNRLNSQPPIFASSSGIFPYAGQPLGYSNMVIQTEGCRRKVCYRRKGFPVENDKHGSQNNDIIEISDSEDESKENKCDEKSKFQGEDGNEDIKPPPDLTLCLPRIPWHKKDILNGTEFSQRIYSTLGTERQSEKKEILLEKCKEEYNNEEISFKAAQQGSNSLSQLTKEAYLWDILTQLTSTEAVGKDRSYHSQKHIEHMTRREHDIEGPDSVYHSSSINLQSNIFPFNDSVRSLFYKKGLKESDAYLPEFPEKSINSNANDGLKVEGNLLQSCEVTKENTQDIYLNNFQHISQQHDASKSKLAGAEEIVESRNHMSNSVAPEPESLHYSVKNAQSATLQVNRSISVPSNNRGASITQKIDSETENVLMEHSQLVTEDDNDCLEICYAQQLADLKLENSQASDDIDKKQADDIYEVEMDYVCQETCKASGDTIVKQTPDIHEEVTEDDNDYLEICYEQQLADLKLENSQASDDIAKKQADDIYEVEINDVCQETCKASGDTIVKQSLDFHGEDTNDVAEKLYETPDNIDMKPANETQGIDLDNVTEKTCEMSSNTIMKQVDTPHRNNLNDVTVKERLITNQSPSNQNSKTSVGVARSKEESNVKLYSDENVKQHFNIDKQHSQNENIAGSQSQNKQNTEDMETENATENNTETEDQILIQPDELEDMEVNNEKTACSFENSDRLSPVNAMDSKTETENLILIQPNELEDMDVNNEKTACSFDNSDRLSPVNATESKTETEGLILIQPNELEDMDVNNEKTACSYENSDRLSPVNATESKTETEDLMLIQPNELEDMDVNNEKTACSYENSDRLSPVNATESKTETEDLMLIQPNELEDMDVNNEKTACSFENSDRLSPVDAIESKTETEDLILIQPNELEDMDVNNEKTACSFENSDRLSPVNATESKTETEDLILIKPNELEDMDGNNEKTACSYENSDRLSPVNETESKTETEDLMLIQPNELEDLDVNNEKTACSFENSDRFSPEADCKVTQCEYVTASSTSGSYNKKCNLFTNVQESVSLKSVSNVHPEADSTVTFDTTCEDYRSQQSAAELSSENLTDSDLKKKICAKNSSNGPHETHPAVKVNENCESSRPQVAAELSSGNLNNTNLQEISTLKDNSSVPHVANCTVSDDRSCEGSRPQPVAELSSSNLSDNNLQEKLNLRNSSNVLPVIDSSVTVDGGCEGSRPQPATELSSANLIEQLVQCQQNSRVFDPLVSMIKARPIVGDFALRYDMMVKKELARLYKKEAKQKEKRHLKKIGAIGDSKTKKKKKKKIFTGKGFCGFRDNDKDMDGCGPGKGGFSGGALTFTAIVSSFSCDGIFNFYDNFLTKGVDIRKRCKAVIKQSKDLSRTLHITCWLLYFGFQHVCPFSL